MSISFDDIHRGMTYMIVEALWVYDLEQQKLHILKGTAVVDLGLKNSIFEDHLCLSSIGLVWIEDFDFNDSSMKVLL